MKIKLWLSLIALTAIGFAQTTEEQIATSYRIQAKPGKDAALKAALIAHGEKFHGGANSWRIAQVISGMQEGMFQINEGPNTFAGLEERGDLGPEHMAEYDQTITPLVESRTGSNYLRFRPEYSTGTIIPKNGMKVTLRIFYLKPGRLDHLMASMNLIKNTWENLGGMSHSTLRYIPVNRELSWPAGSPMALKILASALQRNLRLLTTK